MSLPTHRDSISGRTRTWPYGTKKRVRVLGVEPAMCMIVSDGIEGYVLVDAIPEGVQDGDAGTITFTEGGPLGGYWKFEKDLEGGR